MDNEFERGLKTEAEADLAKEAAGLQSQLVEWRRALHQMPETGTKLPQTIAFIKERLD